MKKIFYLFASAILLTYSSCSNDSDIIIPSISDVESVNDDVIIIDSEEKLMEMFSDIEPSNIEPLSNREISTKSFEYITESGYSYYTSNGPEKTGFIFQHFIVLVGKSLAELRSNISLPSLNLNNG